MNSRIAPTTNVQLYATGTLKSGLVVPLTSAVTWTSATPGVATVSNTAPINGRVTGVAAGTVAITATDPATGISGTTNVTVTSAVLQSITVLPAEPPVAANSFLAYSAIGYFSDGTSQTITSSVNWSIDAGAARQTPANKAGNAVVATVSNTPPNQGVVTTFSAGAVGVIATDPTTNISNGQVVQVTPATLQSLTITPSNAKLAPGSPVTFAVEGSYSDGTVQNLARFANVTSSNPNVLFVSNTAPTIAQGFAVAAGTVSVSANFAGVSTSTNLTVSSATQVSASLSPVNPQIAVNTTVTLVASGVFSDNTPETPLTNGLIWTSSNPAVADVSNAPGTQGQISGLSAGTATITATNPLNKVSVSTTVTVFQSTLVALTLTPNNAVTIGGVATTFEAIGTFANNQTQRLPVTWTSSDSDIFPISTAGTINPVPAASSDANQATITATYAPTGISASTTLTELGFIAPTTITVTPASANATLNGPGPRFVATGNFPDGSTLNLSASVTWTSSNPAVATISNNPRGQTSLVGTGTSTITATFPSMAGITTGTTTLTVSNATASSLALGVNNFTLPVNVSRTVTSTETYSDNTTQTVTGSVSYTSSNPSVAVVSDSTNGQVTGLSAGTTTLTAVDPVNGLTNSTTVTVTSATLTSFVINPNNSTGTVPTVGIGTTRNFSAVGTYSDNSTATISADVTWSSSAPATASVVPNSGVVTGLAPGTATITATDRVSGVTTSTLVQVRYEEFAAATSNGVYGYGIITTAGSATPGALSSGGAPFATANAITDIALDSSGAFGAGTSYSQNQVTVETFSVLGANAQLGTTATGNQPGPVVFDAQGQFFFVLNQGDNTIGTYDYSSAALTPSVALTAVNGTGPFSMAATPNGKRLLVLAAGATPTLNIYSVAANGTLAQVASQTLTGSPSQLQIDESGKFVYLVDEIANTVSSYSLSGNAITATGNSATLPANFYPTTAVTPGTNPQLLAQDPAGRFLFVLGTGSSQQVMAYTVANGVLTAVAGGPYSAGNGPIAITVDSSGRYVYVVNSADSTISAFIIQGVTGALAPVSGSPFTTGSGPTAEVTK